MIEITWLGHGTFQLKLESGEVIVLDPWTDGNPAYPPATDLRSRGRDPHLAWPFRSHSRRRAACQAIQAEGRLHL